jgi:hypothetical protein
MNFLFLSFVFMYWVVIFSLIDNSTSWVVMQVFAQFSLLFAFLSFAYIYYILKSIVPDVFGWSLAVFVVCVFIPHLVCLFALLPIFLGDSDSRVEMAYFAPLLGSVMLFGLDMIYAYFYVHGDAWLPGHLATVGLNTEGEDEEDDFSASTVFVHDHMSVSDSETSYDRPGVGPYDSETGEGSLRESFHNARKKNEELSEGDALLI